MEQEWLHFRWLHAFWSRTFCMKSSKSDTVCVCVRKHIITDKRKRDLSVQLFIWNRTQSHSKMCVFGIPAAGSDHKATLKPSKLPWDGSSSHFTVLMCTGRPCRPLRGWLKLEHIHLNPPPANANGCQPVLEWQWSRKKDRIPSCWSTGGHGWQTQQLLFRFRNSLSYSLVSVCAKHRCCPRCLQQSFWRITFHSAPSPHYLPLVFPPPQIKDASIMLKDP